MSHATIEIGEEAGVRTLHLGTPWIHGAMRIARPWALELEYTRHMLLPLLLQPGEWPLRVLSIGLGSGSLPKFLWRHRPQCLQQVVELEDQVVQAAQHYFRLPANDPRLAITVADGYTWMAEATGTYDLILLDAFDRNARASRLESPEFYAACRARLAPGGFVACNLLTLHRSHAATRRALQAVFGDAHLLLPPCAEGNVVALAAATRWTWPDPPALREAAQTLRRQTQLNLLPLVAALGQNPW